MRPGAHMLKSIHTYSIPGGGSTREINHGVDLHKIIYSFSVMNLIYAWILQITRKPKIFSQIFGALRLINHVSDLMKFETLPS